MPDAPEPSTEPKGKGNFFTQKVAGVPLVAWVAVLALAVGAFLWWRNRQQAAAGGTTASAASSVPTADTSEELLAAGLYQPPNVTYDVSAPATESATGDATLPGGPTVGSVIGAAATASPPAIPPVSTSGPTPASIAPAAKIAPSVQPKAPAPKYMTVTSWPSPTSTLSGIAKKVNVPLATIERLNPQIKNPNLVYAGENIRYA